MEKETEKVIGEVKNIGSLLNIFNLIMLPLGCILINIGSYNNIISVGLMALVDYLVILFLLNFFGNIIISILYVPVIAIMSMLENNKNIMSISNVLHTIFFTTWAIITFFFINEVFPKMNLGQLVLLYPLITLPFVQYCSKNQDIGLRMFIYVFCLELASLIFILITLFTGIKDIKIFLLFAFITWVFMQRYTKYL